MKKVDAVPFYSSSPPHQKKKKKRKKKKKEKQNKQTPPPPPKKKKKQKKKQLSFTMQIMVSTPTNDWCYPCYFPTKSLEWRWCLQLEM